MATDDQTSTPGTRGHFLRVAPLRRGGTRQADVELCRAQGSFTPACDAMALAQRERIHGRRWRKQITHAQGRPVFGTIARVGPEGTPARVCLQKELFGPEVSRPTVASHGSLARHHLCKAQTSRDHTKARDGLQLPLFSEDDGEVGGEGEA